MKIKIDPGNTKRVKLSKYESEALGGKGGAKGLLGGKINPPMQKLKSL